MELVRILLTRLGSSCSNLLCFFTCVRVSSPRTLYHQVYYSGWTALLTTLGTQSQDFLFLLPIMSDNDGGQKRKREAADVDDAHRMNRHAHNGGLQGIQGKPVLHSYSCISLATEHSITGYEPHGLSTNGNDLSNIDQALLQHVGGAGAAGQNGVTDDNAMTAKAALAHQSQSKYPPPNEYDNNALAQNLTFGGDVDSVTMPGVHGHNSTADAVFAARQAQNLNQPKPAVGTAEWHAIRKNNHKEGKTCSFLTVDVSIRF